MKAGGSLFADLLRSLAFGVPWLLLIGAALRSPLRSLRDEVMTGERPDGPSRPSGAAPRRHGLRALRQNLRAADHSDWARIEVAARLRVLSRRIDRLLGPAGAPSRLEPAELRPLSPGHDDASVTAHVGDYLDHESARLYRRPTRS